MSLHFVVSIHFPMNILNLAFILFGVNCQALVMQYPLESNLGKLLSRNRTTYGSQTYFVLSYQLTPNKAVDGNHDGDIFKGITYYKLMKINFIFSLLLP